MNIETFRTYCLAKKGVTECFPFDETTLVFKVLDKMFALSGIDGEFSMNLKCDPDLAIQLREQYPEVKPGYHMNKRLWNTVTPNDNILESLLEEWIDNSYDLIVAKMTKKKQAELKEM